VTTAGDSGATDLRRRLDIGAELARPTWRSPRRLLTGWFWQTVGVTISLAVAIWLIPSLSASTPWAVVGAAVLIGVVGAILNPLLARLAVALGWLGVGLLALFAEVLVVYVAIGLSPGIAGDSFWDAFLASWIVAIVGQLMAWLTHGDQENAFLAEVLRRGLRDAPEPPADGQTGVVFVQMDGVSHPLLEWALMAGNLPTLNRWVRSGSHVTREWTTRLPSTTPISQAGILHGTSENMPAFRWYEKDRQKLVVANNPPDAALIESRISDGRGLLADDGVSISNLFSGDATRSLLTMSAIGARRPGGKPRDFISFFATPYGFSRAVTRTVAEMVKEIYQAKRQVRQNVEPRVPRHGFYVVLRGFTNVLQRDLNVVLVAEQMLRGAKSVYVDFLDYDEIAHHAGLARPESLAAVQGIDAALGRLEAVARYAPRDYEFVVLSDHGQSQGSTFKQRYGEPLEEVVRGLMGGARDVVAATGKDEDYGPLNAFLSSLAGGSSMSSRMTKGAFGDKADGDVVSLGPTSDTVDDVEETSELVVAGSGNLGLVWFPQQPGRLTLERAEELWPGLVGALAAHGGTSFVMVHSEARGPVVLGSGGVRVLDTDEVEGVDPLAPFDDHIADDLRRLSAFENAADIYLNSVFDPESGEVAAFEELVGCHGGTGGWQTRPMLVHPAHWPVDDEQLLGAEAVHRQLVQWLEALGHRADLQAPTSTAP
jgi:uncharacterized membrane protein YvlD (DUF360 family)